MLRHLSVCLFEMAIHGTTYIILPRGNEHEFKNWETLKCLRVPSPV